MSGSLRVFVCLGLVVSPGVAYAQAAPKPVPTKSQKATPTKKEADAAKPSEAAPASDTASKPLADQASAPSEVKDSKADSNAADASSSASGAPENTEAKKNEPPTVRVYMRSGIEPLVFSARAKNDTGTPTWCAAPCDQKLLPGDYQLKLNGVVVEGSVALKRPGTLEGKLESHENGREGGWLALNVGGILGGVFITVAALGGPSWTYIAGGGTLLTGGAIFVLTYRSDRATVSFAPNEPVDIRGLPPPIPADVNSSGPAHSADWDRPRFGDAARGLGFRVTF
ncbi:MAG TPA: hypothetical protein VHV51_09380 [Polyangiaceae bacterium]|jgi:hypothetical protein|nr:hypothetical protein [Polyangiaceae bacterium]